MWNSRSAASFSGTWKRLAFHTAPDPVLLTWLT